MSKAQPVISSKFYRLFEKKQGAKNDSKAIVTLGDKEYVKFPFEAIFVNEQVVLYFIIETQSSIEFDYVKIQISILHNQKKQIVHSLKQISKTLKKGSPHHMPFSFKVSQEGEYLIRTATSYKEKQFISSPQSSQLQEKEQTAVMRLQISKIFSIKQKVIYLQKQKLITYPLLIQYSVQNLTDKPRSFKADFVSQKFFIQNMDPKPVYQMNSRQIQNVIIKLNPKDLHTLYQTTKLGYFRLFWQKDGKQQKPLTIKFDHIVKIKCTSITKSIPKKDVHTVRIRIQKKLDFEYPGIQIFVKDIKEQSNPSIRILNINKNKIFLADRPYDEIDLSVVGLASGCHLIKGLKLRSIDGGDIPYENEIMVMIMNQSQQKQQKKIFEATGSFDVFDLVDL